MLLGTGLGVLGAVSGCSGDGLGTGKVIDPSELYWALELNHRAVTLAPVGEAPYDTLTLVATPRTADGSVLGGLPAPTYVSADPEKVAVASDGRLQGIAPTNPGEVVMVVATLTAGNLKHVDTALVAVVAADPQPVLTSFSIHPTPPDSAKVGIGSVAHQRTQTTTCFALPTWTETPFLCAIVLPVRVLDAAGDSIPGVPVAFRSSDKETAFVDADGSIVTGTNAPGREVTLVASTTVFGVAKADTLPFRTGWPFIGNVGVDQTGFTPSVVKIGVGAIVTWTSSVPSAVDINFADPTNVAAVGQPSFLPPGAVFVFCQILLLCEDAGNAVLTASDPDIFGAGVAWRRFPVPGVYDYVSSALGGTSGRILVLDEP